MTKSTKGWLAVALAAAAPMAVVPGAMAKGGGGGGGGGGGAAFKITLKTCDRTALPAATGSLKPDIVLGVPGVEADVNAAVPNATLNVVVDGTTIGTVTTDAAGFGVRQISNPVPSPTSGSVVQFTSAAGAVLLSSRC
jgi:large repetitive protein